MVNYPTLLLRAYALIREGRVKLSDSLARTARLQNRA
jgi:hypothetical protein